MKNQIIFFFCLSLLLGACGKVKRPQHNIYTKNGERWVLVEYRDINNNVVEDFFEVFEFELPAERNNSKGRKYGNLSEFVYGSNYDSTVTFFTMPESSVKRFDLILIIDDSKGDEREVYWRIGSTMDEYWIGEFRLAELSKSRMVLERNYGSTASNFSPAEYLVFEKQ